MRTISSTEAKAIREILLIHESRTLSPGCDDPDGINIMLDNLRSMLMDIAEGVDFLSFNNSIKAVGQLIHAEDQKMEAMRKTKPDKVDEQFCYILGLAKALSMIQAV